MFHIKKHLTTASVLFLPFFAQASVIDTGDFYYDSSLDGANIVGEEVMFLRPSLLKDKSYSDLMDSKYWDDGYRFATTDQYYDLFESATGFDLNQYLPDGPMPYDIDEKGYSVFMDLLGMDVNESVFYGVSNDLVDILDQDYIPAEQMYFLPEHQVLYGIGEVYFPKIVNHQDWTGTLLMAKTVETEDISPRTVTTTGPYYTPVNEPPAFLLFCFGLLSLLMARNKTS